MMSRTFAFAFVLLAANVALPLAAAPPAPVAPPASSAAPPAASPGECAAGQGGDCAVPPSHLRTALAPDKPPAAAEAACAQEADRLQNVAPGISKLKEGARQGDRWVLTIASGTYRSICTVTPQGQVTDIQTGGY